MALYRLFIIIIIIYIYKLCASGDVDFSNLSGDKYIYLKKNCTDDCFTSTTASDQKHFAHAHLHVETTTCTLPMRFLQIFVTNNID